MIVCSAAGGASPYTVQYDVAGRAVKTKYAAGGDLWRTQSYAPFTTAVQGGQLTAIDVGTQAAPGALLHLGYVYDEFGNTGTITETTTANVLSYDGQSRVTQAFGATFSYQPSGRFNAFEGRVHSYGTGAAASPLHAVVSTNAGGVFTYDAAGNMLTRKTSSAAPMQTLAWSAANELLSVTTGATVESYRYDADGTRIYQESRTSGALSWQQFDYFPHYSVKVASGVTTPTKYYFFNGRRIAQKVGDGALTYLHGDHLGSTVLTTGVSGNQKYHAYGALRAGGVQSDYQFTGQEADGGTGLIYMKARYYDPVIGQFISPDTVVPDPNNVYAYNRYMYAYGNPVKHSDPSGHCVFGLDTIVCIIAAATAAGAGAGFAGNVAGQAWDQWDDDESLVENLKSFDVSWTEAGIAAGAGAIGGGVAPIVGPGAYIAINGVVGAAQKVATDVIVDERTTSEALSDPSWLFAGAFSAGAAGMAGRFPDELIYPVSNGDKIVVATGEYAAAMGGKAFAAQTNAALVRDQINSVAGARATTAVFTANLPWHFDWLDSWFTTQPEPYALPCTADPNDDQ